MIFQYTWEKVLSGEKTQTRRLVKTVDRQRRADDGAIEHVVYRTSEWVDTSDPVRWSVGHTYAVQPGRGQSTIYYKRTAAGLSVWDAESLPTAHLPRGVKVLPPKDYTPLRIEITRIRREDVRTISEADARAEGFESIGDFWFTWISMHDKSFLETYRYAHDTDQLREYDFYSRPAARYDAWVLDFKGVQP